MPVSEEQISALFKNEDTISENRQNYTKGTYTSNMPEELDTVFYTYYSPECIKCIREGERNPENPDEKTGEDKLQWEIKLDSREQYDKIMKFLSGFPQEDNFRFATRQFFWNDFLDEKIDMESFFDFYAWTNSGSPDMEKGENGEQVGINKERIKESTTPVQALKHCERLLRRPSQHLTFSLALLPQKRGMRVSSSLPLLIIIQVHLSFYLIIPI